MDKSTKNTLIISGSVVAAAGIAALVWWLTRRRRENVILGLPSSGGNVVTGAVQTVIDKTKEIMGMQYFTINELCRSATAAAQKPPIDNTPTPEIRAKLESLVVNCLDPIRRIYGKPIIVSSGYRSPALNDLLIKQGSGAVKGSQHTLGEAADIVPASGGSLRGIFDAAMRHGNFDQLIVEDKTRYGGGKWIHISYGPRMRHNIYWYRFDGTGYHPITSWPYNS